MRDTAKEIKERIEDADAVLIGASNGLSISDGWNIFADDDFFREHFGDFRAKYGIRNMLQGMFLPFKDYSEKWAYFARAAYLASLKEQSMGVTEDLYNLIKDKDYFVLTTNGEDRFIPSGFSEDRVFEMEGKLTEYRCSKKCSDEVYRDRETIFEAAKAERNGRVPEDKIPKCPHCGAYCEPNLAGDASFFETADWQNKRNAFQKFLERNRGKKLLILELGIGSRNQMIKAPIMNIALSEPNAYYITVNKGDLFIPEQLKPKSLGIDADIARLLNDAANAPI